MNKRIKAGIIALLMGFVLVGGSLLAGTAPVYAGGSDAPTPYTVSAAGITLPGGATFQDNGHVNVKTTNQGDKGIHFESLNNQPSGQWIGKSFLPWSAFGYNSDTICVKWVQVAGYNEHFGEGGQAPVGPGCESTPPSSTPPVEKPPICHPVNGKGELGNGWNLISPDKASSHIDESLYPDGHYWKHESNDGLRHDIYSNNGVCPGEPVVDDEYPYEVDACWTMSHTDGIENTYQFPQTYGCDYEPKCEETVEFQYDTYWIRDEADEAHFEEIKANGLDSPADDNSLEPHDYYSEVVTNDTECPPDDEPSDTPTATVTITPPTETETVTLPTPTETVTVTPPAETETVTLPPATVTVTETPTVTATETVTGTPVTETATVTETPTVTVTETVTGEPTATATETVTQGVGTPTATTTVTVTDEETQHVTKYVDENETVYSFDELPNTGAGQAVLIVFVVGIVAILAGLWLLIRRK